MRSDKTFLNLFKKINEKLPKDSKIVSRLELVVSDVFSKPKMAFSLENIRPPSGPVPKKNKNVKKKGSDNQAQIIDLVDLSSDNDVFRKKKKKFPIKIGKNFKILSIGKIVFDNNKWHTSRFIFPNGYKILFMKSGENKNDDKKKKAEQKKQAVNKNGVKNEITKKILKRKIVDNKGQFKTYFFRNKNLSKIKIYPEKK
ncbi:hypothetical protein MHBO_003823 [Bonamia ostreae]|uniref:Uncharacterized protein n=1 Tax=Bonamia ostreae TaxID=126728 RepID=A0ABV2AS89_9EUKA